MTLSPTTIRFLEAAEREVVGSAMYNTLVNDAALAQQAAETIEAVIESGAVRMHNAPWRINHAVTGKAIWPPEEGVSQVELLGLCRKYIAACRAQGKAGSWVYNHSRHIALRQAERALIRMIGDK